MISERQQWEHRMSYFGLSFCNWEQIYPKPRDKKHGGSVRPSITTETDHNQLENYRMETTTELNGKNEKTADLTPEQAAKIAMEHTAELKASRTLQNRAINAAVIASGVAVGAGTALTAYHLLTKK